MQEDNLDQEWLSVLRRWRLADGRIRVPNAPVREILARATAVSDNRIAPEWMGVAAVLAIAIMFPFGMRHLDDAIQSESDVTIVPVMASERVMDGPCSAFTSCLSQAALMERIEPY